jgi:hypothetical protein
LKQQIRQKLAEGERMAEPSATPGLDMEAILKIIGQMNADNQTNMLAAIAEMKKPTAREQKKLDEEELKLAQHQQSRIKLAQAEEDRKRMQASSCAHATTHPGTGVTKHCWRAQVHTPHLQKPYFVPTCTQCFTQLPHILATTEMLTQGVNLDQYAALNIDVLRNWAKSAEKAQETAA